MIENISSMVSIPSSLIALVVYFFPGIVALIRGHHSKVAVLLLNLFLGWTVLGWLWALIWAFTNPSTVIIRGPN
ncbi:MAG: Superinfection immunity protein [Candidatus Kentron sp. G]|nr:MAG: Superinfection immunity protein [Candidatus Kentron sp. G]VFN00358.1 MAG: Superinfection immunity protein [Candidatus Kentron sp. G]VFN00519.1 MAG: Superinfection immunity protein [Candidatus Kentron sp. G]